MALTNVKGSVRQPSAQVITSKAVAVGIVPLVTRDLLIHGDDGGRFYAITGAAPGTYSDDGGSYCGTQFIPTGGDGSAVWKRDTSTYLGWNVNWFGIIGDGTDSSTMWATLMSSMPVIGGLITFPRPTTHYLSSTDFDIPTGKGHFHIKGEHDSVEIRFTSTSANGFTVAGEHDNLYLDGLYLNANNNSTGMAIDGTACGSGTPLRDFNFNNISYTGFLNGAIIYGHINGQMQGGRQTGQGKAVAGGVGIQVGEDVNFGGNGFTLGSVYISTFETDFWNKYASPTTIVGTPIMGNATTAIKNSSGGAFSPNLFTAGIVYFDSSNDTAIDNDGYMTWNGHFSSIGTQTVTTSTHRFFKVGYQNTKIVAYLGTANQTGILTATPTKIEFNAEEEDTESHFANYKYTATYPGYRQVNLTVQVRAGTADKQYKPMIYLTGASVAEKIHHGPAAVPVGMSVEVNKLVWMNKDDYIEGYIQHEEGVDLTIYLGQTKTYMTITDG